ELYLGEVEDMADAVQHGRPPAVSLAESRGNVAALVALYRSAREGRPAPVAALAVAALLLPRSVPAAPPPRVAWPDGARAALSLSFDDARTSQVDVGLALLDSLGAKVTFYLVPSAVESRLEGWKRAAAAGHEIANHSLTHPCSGNFP